MVLYTVSVTFWMLYIVAAFVIAYLILQFLIGKPMYFMELVMGQFSGKGPTAVWNMNPSAKGKVRMPHCISYNGYRCGQLCLIVTVIISILLFSFPSAKSTYIQWCLCFRNWYLYDVDFSGGRHLL